MGIFSLWATDLFLTLLPFSPSFSTKFVTKLFDADDNKEVE
jgi:hypothetical protein